MPQPGDTSTRHDHCFHYDAQSVRSRYESLLIALQAELSSMVTRNEELEKENFELKATVHSAGREAYGEGIPQETPLNCMLPSGARTPVATPPLTCVLPLGARTPVATPRRIGSSMEPRVESAGTRPDFELATPTALQSTEVEHDDNKDDEGRLETQHVHPEHAPHNGNNDDEGRLQTQHSHLEHMLHAAPRRLSTRMSNKVSAKRFRDQFQRLDVRGEGSLSDAACFELVKRFEVKDPRRGTMTATLQYLQGNTLNIDDGVELTFDAYLELMRMSSENLEGLDAQNQTSLLPLQRAFHAEDAFGTANAHVSSRHYLDIIPAPVIILNAIVMGLRADLDPEATIWLILDLCFLCFYIAESVTKFLFFGVRTYWCGPDKFWNWFDVLCIMISVLDLVIEKLLPVLLNVKKTSDVGPLMLVKMLRLCRLGRLVRALRYPFFAELKVIVFGVLSGLRVLLWAIVLLVVSIYFFGVAMNGIAKKEETLAEFDTVPRSMFTLFRCFTDGCAAYDGTPLQERLFDMYGAWFMIAYVLVYMFVTFGLFNLIMAIFIDNVVSSAMTRRQKEVAASEGHIRSEFEIMFTKLILLTRHIHMAPSERQLLEEQLDKDATKAFDLLPDDLTIPFSTFKAWAQTQEFHDVMGEADIDVANQLHLFDVLDADISGELGLCELVDGLVRLRGSSTKSDMVAISLKIEYITKLLQAIGKKTDIDPFDIS